MMRKRCEASEQAAVFEWANRQGQVSGYEPLLFMWHTPNGGSRNLIEAAHLKAQGVKSGVPDIELALARGGYHGLFVEMKFGRNKLTRNQKRYMDYLRRSGYAVAVCYSADEAIATIEKYIRGEGV